MRRFWLKLFRRRRLDADLEAELAFHREMAAAHGNPIPLGNGAIIREQAYDLWRFNPVENLWRDVAYAFRTLSGSPAFLLSALLSLGLGIGVNTAMFSIAVEFLLSEPSVREPESVVSVRLGGNSHAKPEAIDLASGSGLMQDIAGQSETHVNWNDGRETRPMFAIHATPNFFTALGVPLALGRGWNADDPPEVAVLHHRFWLQQLGGDPAIVGRAINLNGRSYTVLGVLPESHRTLLGMGLAPALYMPAPRDAILAVYARLKPGMTLPEARAAFEVLGERLDRAMPERYFQYAKRQQIVPLAGLARLRPDKEGTPINLFFLVLLVLVGLVFLIACVNVASLQLARASARRQEIAIRLSIGASRGRLLQQLLAESLLLSIAGAIGGLLLAFVAARLLASIPLPLPVPVHLRIDPDWRVAVYAALLGIGSTVICGLLPAWQTVRDSLASGLRKARRQRLRRLLVAAQVAIAVIVLLTGVLFLRNLLLTGSMSPGFDIHRTIRAEAHLLGERSVSREIYVTRALEQLRALPGIEIAAAAAIIPFTDGATQSATLSFLESGEKKDARFHWNAVSPHFFRAMDIPILSGRDFTVNDRAGAASMVIVNKTFVDRYLDGRNAIGASFRWGDQPQVYQIAAVVPPTKNMTIGEDDKPQLYQPLEQSVRNASRIQFVLRSATPPTTQLAAVREALRRVEPSTGLEVNTMYASIGLAFLPSRIGAALMGSVGLLGLLLAAVGIFGVTAYSVARRTREIGVRIAIGATRASIARLVLFDSARVLAAGAAVGLVLALFAARPLAMFLVAGLSPADPWSIAAVVLILALAGLLATFEPVRRATRVDPVASLRCE